MDRFSDADVHRWAESADRWWRRTALVSTVALNLKVRGGQGDVARTLPVCRLLAADGDDMVFKALSWALRVWRRTTRRRWPTSWPSTTTAWRPGVKREVGTKLTTGRRTRADNCNRVPLVNLRVFGG